MWGFFVKTALMQAVIALIIALIGVVWIARRDYSGPRGVTGIRGVNICSKLVTIAIFYASAMFAIVAIRFFSKPLVLGIFAVAVYIVITLIMEAIYLILVGYYRKKYQVTPDGYRVKTKLSINDFRPRKK